MLDNDWISNFEIPRKLEANQSEYVFELEFHCFRGEKLLRYFVFLYDYFLIALLRMYVRTCELWRMWIMQVRSDMKARARGS